ncbi:MAG: M28 family peptidase [Terriglobales bacterium]
MKALLRIAALLAAVAALAAPTSDLHIGDDARYAAATMKADRMLDVVKELSSDAYQGRAPGTDGETKTLSFLEGQFREIGLKPLGRDYRQQVPLLTIRSQAQEDFALEAKAQFTSPQFGADFFVLPDRPEAEIKIVNSQLVFCGYGIVAPEYGWDDYKSVDVRGKTVIVLDIQPRRTDVSGAVDPAFFRGDYKTWYGTRWYKAEEAARHGAAAILMVNDPASGSVPYQIYANRINTEQSFLVGDTTPQPLAAGWIKLEAVRRLFRSAQTDFDQLRATAQLADFKPVPLYAALNATLRSQVRKVTTRNLVGMIQGSDAKLKQQYVIYSAHWDHLGMDPQRPGDNIFHGASDNAGGTAQLLEVARAFRALKMPPRRSIIFLSTSSEEQGLLGSAYYAQHPLVPLSATIAEINLDRFNQLGRTKDLDDAGDHENGLKDIESGIAALQDRVVVPQTRPQMGLFYMSDQFSFAKRGIVATYIGSGSQYLNAGKPEFEAHRKDAAGSIHQVTDQVKPWWDLRGALEDAQFSFYLGYELAARDQPPAWQPGSTFAHKK